MTTIVFQEDLHAPLEYGILMKDSDYIGYERVGKPALSFVLILISICRNNN